MNMMQKSLIDFCIVSSDLFSEMLDVRVKPRAELCQLITNLLFALQFSKPWPNRNLRWSSVACRIKWEALADKDVRKRFASNMAKKFQKLPIVSEDIEIK